MSFTPVSDRIVGIELVEKVTRGGIVIPDTAAGNDPSKQKCLRIQVTAMGPGTIHVDERGVRRVTIANVLGEVLSVGDVVITNRYTNVMKVDGQDVRIFGPSDVIGIERDA